MLEGTPSGGSAPDIDVDALLNQIESPGSSEIPMTAAGAEPSVAQAPPQPPQEYEFTANGKPIKAPLDKILQWASQGYDYPQKMAELNRRQQEFEAQQRALKEIEGRYKPIDDYVRENPQWWEHVESSWKQREQAFDPNNPIAQEIQALRSRLGEQDQIIQEWKQEREQRRIQTEDAQYQEQMESIRKEFPNLDLTTPGADGKSLEYKVLEYAQKEGIRNFKTAFRDFYHDEILKLHAERAKEESAKDLQKKTKLGLLGKSPTPQQSLAPVQNLKSKSYESILDEVKAELGLGA